MTIHHRHQLRTRIKPQKYWQQVFNRVKERKYIYIVPFILCIVSKHSYMDHSFTCKLHHACLSIVSVHQMAPPLTEVADIQLQVTTHLLTLEGWKAELAWLDDPLRMVYHINGHPSATGDYATKSLAEKQDVRVKYRNTTRWTSWKTAHELLLSTPTVVVGPVYSSVFVGLSAYPYDISKNVVLGSANLTKRPTKSPGYENSAGVDRCTLVSAGFFHLVQLSVFVQLAVFSGFTPIWVRSGHRNRASNQHYQSNEGC